MLKYLALAVAGEARAAVRREATAAALFAVGALVMLLAVVFAVVAARDWLALSRGLSFIEADLAVAAVLVVIALVLVAAGVYRRRRRTESSPLAASAILAAPVAAGALGRRVSVGTLVAVAAVLAGAYLGRQAGRR
jgi:hypothetical protein